MRDDLGVAGRVIAALLPSRAAERLFLPAYHA
jgi:hypothetical protein